MTEGRQLHPSILREYDIRGIVNKTMDVADVKAIGRAFGTILVGEGGNSVAVGYDGRLSSPELEAALVEGLAACGLTVFRVGLGPTPMLYYSTYLLEADAGMMITGSHNPPDYNGIKMTMMGRAFFGHEITELGKLVSSGVWVNDEGRVAELPIIEEYVSRIFSDFSGNKELRVAWDPGNGSAGDATVMLTDMLPGKHFLINEKIDGKFPAHHPDPTVEDNLAQLKELVHREKCDLGIAFDGDGDRIGVIDSKGRVLWGDQLLVILARAVLVDHPGATIIADVKASQVFFDEITRMGGKPLMWKTGHSHIKNKMAEIGAPLAGEMSAHIFFKHRYYGYDDAMYTAVRLLSELSTGKESLDDIYDAMPHMLNTPEIRFDCDDSRKFEVVNEVKTRLADAPKGTVLDIDGVRVITPDGWWLLRASNTQSVLVARCESTTKEGLDRLKAELVAALVPSGINPPAF